MFRANQAVWIGLKKDKFNWTDGTELDYEDWYRGYPKYYTQENAVAYLHKSYRWKWFDTNQESATYIPLCKIKKHDDGKLI